MKCMRAVESDSMKSARKAKGKWHKACERASEICEQTLHRQEQNRLRMVSISLVPRLLYGGGGKRAWYTLFAHAPSSLGNLHTTPLY